MKINRTRVICALVVILVALLIAHWIRGNGKPTDIIVNTAPAPRKSSPAPARDIVAPPLHQEKTSPLVSADPRLITRLSMNGLPFMSAPRRLAMKLTAGEDAEDLAADIGNYMVLQACKRSLDTLVGANQLSYFQMIAPANVIVLRLVGIGREKPEMVSRYIEAALPRWLESYGNARELWKTEWRAWCSSARGAPFASEIDFFYERNRRYDDPLLEFERLNNAINLSFYVSANLDRINPLLLRQWLLMEKPYQYDCIDMNVWLIDCYFRANSQSSEAEEHRRLLDGLRISGDRVFQTSASAGFGAEDPAMNWTRTNPKSLGGLEILEIPECLPKKLDASAKKAIVENFLRRAEVAREP